MIIQVLGLLIGLGTAAAQTNGLAVEPLPVPQREVWELLIGSGWIVRLVLLLLLATSIGSWGVALAKGRGMRRGPRQAARVLRGFWGAENPGTLQTPSTQVKG